MTERPNYYSILTADVRYDKELKANEKLLFSEITALANKYGYCTASNGYLADLYGVKKTTISHWLIHLKGKNYISIEIERNDKKEIVSRKIYPLSTPIAQKSNRYSTNEQDPIAQKSKENITSINNINSEVDKESKRDRFDYAKFISWFNEIANKNFRNTETNRKYIRARLNEGYTKEDIAKVVQYKVSQWKDNEDMNQYLRFKTLFAPNHFGDYLQEAEDYSPEPQKKKSNTSSARRPERTEEEERLYQLRLYASEHPEIYESDTKGNIAIREELERLERNRVKGGGSPTE